MERKELVYWILWGVVTVGLILLTYIENIGSWPGDVLIAWIMIPITYYASTYFFGIRKIRRWAAIKGIVFRKLNEELNGTFSTLEGLTNFNRSFTGPGGATQEEISKIIQDSVVNQLDNHATNNSIKIDDDKVQDLLDGKYGIFKRRVEILDSFLDRYLDYLEPFVIKRILAIRDNLYYIDMRISIWKKYKDNHWTQLDTEESIVATLTSFIQEIINNLNKLRLEGTFILR